MKKFSNFFLLAFCLATMALFQQCEKESPPPSIDYLPQEFLDWMYFKEGTWWVYQDSLRGGTDSVKVIESYFEIYDSYGGGKEIRNRLNRFVYKTESSVTKEIKTYIASDRCWGNAGLEVDYTCFDIYQEDTNTNLMFCNYPIGYRDSYTFVKARFDSLEVNNKMYYDVVLNYTPSQNSEGGMESWIYMAKGVGIIKEHYVPKGYPEHAVVRELVDSHIVQ